MQRPWDRLVGKEIHGEWTLECLEVGREETASFVASNPSGRRAAIEVAEVEGAGALSRRVAREIEVLRTLANPAIVSPRELETSPDGLLFVVSDAVAAEDLGKRLAREGALGEEAARALCAEILGVVASAHEAGVVHGDLRPEVVHPGDPLRISGWGLGTIALHGGRYAAPERRRGELCDGRADLFAVAAVTLHALTGVPPEEELPTLPDTVLGRVLARALAGDRRARFHGAKEMLAALGGDGTMSLPEKPAWLSPSASASASASGEVVKAREELRPGGLIAGRWLLFGEIGHGGMGTVYEGRHVRTQRRVAVKVLRGDAREGGTAFGRFELEAQAAARIRSEHIVDVLDFGQLDDGSPYLVMELCEGESLQDRLSKRQRLPADEVVPIVLELLDGLAPAHDAGIVHLDLKPANIFLLEAQAGRPADFVKILDFGISKMYADERIDAVAGTPTYMAPEQARGEGELDGRADLYAVGVILYRALSGERPLPAADAAEHLVRLTAGSRCRPLREVLPLCDAALADVVERALEPDKAARFASARDMAASLRAATAPRLVEKEVAPPTLAAPLTRRAGRIGCGAALLVAAAVAIVLGGGALVLFWFFPVAKAETPHRLPDVPEHMVVEVNGTCHLGEMSRVGSYCIFPLSARGERKPLWLGSVLCSDLVTRFGEETVNKSETVACSLKGGWVDLRTDDSERSKKAREIFAVEAEPTIMVGAFSMDTVRVGFIFVGVGLALAIGGWLILVDRRRKRRR